MVDLYIITQEWGAISVSKHCSYSLPKQDEIVEVSEEANNVHSKFKPKKAVVFF
jgi:hypothetical protein